MLRMVQMRTQRNRLSLGLARSKREIEEAQRLRYKVFGEELGMSLIGSAQGVERDVFDQYCTHLMVCDMWNDKLVGTCRVLRPDQALAVGGYRAELEFDLARLRHLRPRLLEIDRLCIHRKYRNGATAMHLLRGLREQFGNGAYDYALCTLSIGMGDGGHYAASLYAKLYEYHSAPAEYRVFPRCSLPLEALNNLMEVEAPPVLRLCLKLGGMLCGAPAWEPEYNTAEFLLLLPLAKRN